MNDVPSMLDYSIDTFEDFTSPEPSVLSASFMAQGVFAEDIASGSLSDIYNVYRGDLYNAARDEGQKKVDNMYPKEKVVLPEGFQKMFDAAASGAY